MSEIVLRHRGRPFPGRETTIAISCTFALVVWFSTMPLEAESALET